MSDDLLLFSVQRQQRTHFLSLSVLWQKCESSDLNVISEETNMDRFLFYLEETGIDVNRFESVKFPGWFISTSYEREDQPLELCQVDTAQRVTAFKMK